MTEATEAATVAREDGRQRPDAGGEATAITIAPAPAGDRPVDARQAARDLASWRQNRDKPKEATEHVTAPDASVEPTQESSSAANAASEDAGAAETQPPGEIESADPAETLPSIEPPRSWTKEDKDLFTSLPRETQERIAQRERSREGDFSRRQQEATEKGKALEAERSKVEQARQHYESALSLFLDDLQNPQTGEFADIKTIADIERLAREDVPRYLRWDLQQRKVALATQNLLAAQERQVSERRQRFAEFVKRQDDLIKEKVPEMADPAKVAKLQDAAVSVLKELGFDEAELRQSWRGEKDLSLHDHRVQLLIRDAIFWRDAQQKAKAAAAKPVPPVQRPGVSQPRGAAQDAAIQNLSKRLEESGSLKDAAALLRARRAAR